MPKQSCQGRTLESEYDGQICNHQYSYEVEDHFLRTDACILVVKKYSVTKRKIWSIRDCVRGMSKLTMK